MPRNSGECEQLIPFRYPRIKQGPTLHWNSQVFFPRLPREAHITQILSHLGSGHVYWLTGPKSSLYYVPVYDVSGLTHFAFDMSEIIYFLFV